MANTFRIDGPKIQTNSKPVWDKEISSDIPDCEEFLKVEEVAARLRVPRSWVYSHATHRGTFRLGKYLRFSWPRVLERLDRPNDGADG
jgi:hypothetical protein